MPARPLPPPEKIVKSVLLAEKIKVRENVVPAMRNPAFARPPKPSKAKPPVIEEVVPEATEDSSRSEITGEVSEETTEAVTE
jgi:hypothetical protein